MKKTTTKQLSYDSIFRICKQLSMLFGAGITPLGSLEVMLEDPDNADLKSVLQNLYHSTEEGMHLSEAVDRSGVFPAYVKELIALGEQTGRMDVVTDRLADYYEEQADVRDSIRNAVSYPILMIFMMFAVMIVLLQRIMPIFEDVFRQLGASTGGAFGVLMNISRTVSRFYVILIVLFAIVAGLFVYFYYTARGQAQFLRFLASFRPTRHFMERVATGHFASGMEMTQSAGLDTWSGLELCKSIVDNETVRARIDVCEENLHQGASMSEAFIRAGMFSTFYSSMLNAASVSGSTDRVMGFISEHYKKETDEKLSRVISAIEPTMVIILSVLVGLILLSIILPLMSIMSSIG